MWQIRETNESDEQICMKIAQCSRQFSNIQVIYKYLSKVELPKFNTIKGEIEESVSM